MEETTEAPEDKLLQAVLSAGKDEDIDLLIEIIVSIFKMECLQQNSKTKYGISGGADGLRMNRIAFAVMLKYSSLSDTLEEVKDELQIHCDSLDPELKGNDRLIELKPLLKGDASFQKLM